MYDQNNVFAKILRGELPAEKVYEDANVLAFKDIHPSAPIHVLVIPKKLCCSFGEFIAQASVPEVSSFWKGVYETVKMLGVAENGYRLVVNTGLDSGQEVPHLHVHILAGKSLGPKICNI
ncbi:MAG: histidine triad nucleotide-binding protein [Holosporales bacterium]|nr:histidine triad nucleotide-binding protein [Holosporales bacterium]